MSSWKRRISWLFILVITGITSVAGITTLESVASASGLAKLEIPGLSMMPTVMPGGTVSVIQMDRSMNIVRGEILILKPPASMKCGVSPKTVIDRVVGLPGETLSSRGNTILVNGSPLKQTWRHTEPLGNPIGRVTIGADRYFVMGDNQADACDSRFWGTVSRSKVLDKVVKISNATSTQPTSTQPAKPTALMACQADGATLETAIAVFEAKNPSIRATENALTATAHGGPFITSWPNNPRFYSFTIVGGVLQIQAAKSGSKPFNFAGPASCVKIGLK